ncbi:Atp synthase f1 complex assembly factor 2 [Dirofilaria immitis]|nr:Atp synthase f1 complex assembly factor 2 [Dirofilaria immitis]
MNIKACYELCRRFSGIPNAKKRFYEEARAVFKPMEEVYNIYLDKHCLVTPKRNPVKITSEALALAVAEEWNMQKFLDKDTILYRLEENNKLLELEERNWNPIVEWVNWEYGLSVKPSYSLLEGSRFLQLIGLQYATESLKSVLLTLATISSRLHVDEAVELALLEQKYQSDIWGKVEWAHDIEREELISRLSAGVLLVHLGDFELACRTKSSKMKFRKMIQKLLNFLDF